MLSNKPKIIAICGIKRSGKDTIADHIISKYDYEKIKLADPLKFAVQKLFNFTDDQVGDSDDKDKIDPNWDITPRQVMQFFGTEVMQYKIQELLPTIGRKFWINSLIKNIKPMKNYIISDLRFQHEYEELRKHNVFIIKVIRPTTNISKDNHLSEEEWQNIPENILIVNDSDINSLLIKVDNALSAM